MILPKNSHLTTATGPMMASMNLLTKMRNYVLYLVAVMLIKIKCSLTW